MSRKKNFEKIVCRFMALILLLSGMCFETVKADSFSLCADSQSEAAIWTACADECAHQCVRETSGISQNPILVTHNRQQTQRTGFFPLQVFFCPVSSPEHSLYYEKMAFLLPVAATVSGHAIICYIHHQDGQKG